MKAIICSDTGELCNDYQEYLQTRHWKRFKYNYNYKQTHKQQCIFCLREIEYIDLHHLDYENLGKETENSVVYSCYHCHRLLHKSLDNREITRGLNSLFEIDYEKEKTGVFSQSFFFCKNTFYFYV